MKTAGIIGINGMVGQKLLAEFQKIKTPFTIKTFGRKDEITPLDIAVLCTDNPDSRALVPQLKGRVRSRKRFPAVCNGLLRRLTSSLARWWCS